MSILRYPRDVQTVEDAEAVVCRMMEAAEARSLMFNDEDWERVFGSSKQELKERETYLQERYRKVPRRRREERAALRRSYAEVRAMLMAPYGLQTVWR